MAQKRKMPKRPKVKSSLEVWQNYDKKCKEVAKHNRDLVASKNKKKKLIQKIKGNKY